VEAIVNTDNDNIQEIKGIKCLSLFKKHGNKDGDSSCWDQDNIPRNKLNEKKIVVYQDVDAIQAHSHCH
jgi:hypothetical protein